MVMSEVFEDVKYRHYTAWRLARFVVLERVLALRHVTIFEAGGGHCWFSAQYKQLGNDVLCSEGRAEHVAWVRQHLPYLGVRQDDYDNLPMKELPTSDVVLHTGLLYHLADVNRSLHELMQLGRVVVLETEVTDSTDPDLACSLAEAGPDQVPSLERESAVDRADIGVHSCRT